MRRVDPLPPPPEAIVRSGSLLARARSYYEQGRHYEAQRLLGRIETLCGPDGLSSDQTLEVDVLRALLALGSADYASAEVYSRRAFEARGSGAELHAEAGLLLARTFARTGRMDECIATLETAGEGLGDPVTSPDIAFRVHRELGQALWSQSRRVEASRHFVTALGLGRPTTDGHAESLRLIKEMELEVMLGTEATDSAVEAVFDVLDQQVSEGLVEGDWRYMLRLLGQLASLGDRVPHDRIAEWLRKADEAHRSQTDPASVQGMTARLGVLAELSAYAAQMEKTHPHDLAESDVCELLRRFELAWTEMDTSQACDWLERACRPFVLARGWKPILSLWRRLFARADNFVGCSGYRAWGESTQAANALAGWCEMVGELTEADCLLRLVYEGNRSAGEDFLAAYSGRRLARSVLWHGEHEQALALLEESLEYRQRDRYASVSSAEWGRWLRAEIYAAAGDLAGAEGLMRAELDRDMEKYGTESMGVATVRTRLAEHLLVVGRTEEARGLLAWPSALPDDDHRSPQPPGAIEYDRLVHRLRQATLAVRLGEFRAVDELQFIADDADALLGPGSAVAAEAATEWAAAEWAVGPRDCSLRGAAAAALRAERRLRHSEHPKVLRAREVLRQVSTEEGE